ncbi:MAG: hypothetical protein K0U93_23770 [Gammaproteobacteria bacterium]|nr:hypothetical protein [Gammaproteobacteria bacterium]
MSYRILPLTVLFGVVTVLAGCAGPARWAEEFEQAANCDMSVDDVEKITGRAVIEREVPSSYQTHVVKDGRTILWLVMRDHKLKSVQVAWEQVMKMRVVQYQKRTLCLPTS